ncbi:MAG: hypothetical protein JOY69_02790 [Candidatus Eremiobacteraeota bacterium]|nr:hypothetical protein [Candidatus Eremiobacteraeota bacterium]
MPSFVRAVIVVVVSAWALVTITPELGCILKSCPSNGLSTDFDGIITDVASNSPASAMAIVPGDEVLAPLPRGLFHDPPPVLTFRLRHGATVRTLTLVPKPVAYTAPQKVRLLALSLAYLIFVFVGSVVLLLKPNAMTWSFYLYCVLRRYGDLGFYWPGASVFFWFNFLAFAVLGGMNCALVTIFALRFPNNRLDGWRRLVHRAVLPLTVLLPAAWLFVLIRLYFYGLASQHIVDVLVWITSLVYLAAAAIFLLTLVQSRGDERQRMRWILIFPTFLVLRVIAINSPVSVPDWVTDALVAVAVCIPITVAYSVMRRRVFDVEFAISRALVYGTITTLVAGIFLLIDWFMGKEFAQTRFTLTAEILVALAVGSWLNMLHRNVDRFVDSTFFRQRHLAEKRLAKAAAALFRAESHDAVDQFLVYEPVQALDLVSAALFHRDEAQQTYVREVAVGWTDSAAGRMTSKDPLVLHLLVDGTPVRLSDITWAAREQQTLSNAVIAMPVMLQDRLISIVLYGPHRNGADIDPDEIQSLLRLVERAGAAYDHIEVRNLREQVAALALEKEMWQRQIAAQIKEFPEPKTP